VEITVIIIILFIAIFFFDFLPIIKKKQKKEIVFYGLCFLASFIILLMRSLHIHIPFHLY